MTKNIQIFTPSPISLKNIFLRFTHQILLTQSVLFLRLFFGGSPNCSKNFPAPLLFIKLNFYTQRKIIFPGSRIYKMPTNNRFKRCHDFKKSDSAPNFYLHILKKLSSICIFWYRKKKVCNLLFEE